MRPALVCIVAVMWVLGVSPSAAWAGVVVLNPDHGCVGDSVTASGTGYQPNHNIEALGWGQTDPSSPLTAAVTDANGAFQTTFTVPQGAFTTQLQFWDVEGQTFDIATFTVDPCPPVNHPPVITATDLTTNGQLVYLNVHFSDPDDDAAGFGFTGVNGSGWGEETHPFSDPSYGHVTADTVTYPFNHLCGTPSQYESDVQFWITDATGLESQPVTTHMKCAGPPPTPPAAPTWITGPALIGCFTCGGGGAIRLQWVDRSDNESAFEIEATGGGCTHTCKRSAQKVVGRGSGTGVDWPDWPPGAHVCFRLRAVNGYGSSAWTRTRCVDTPPNPHGGGGGAAPGGSGQPIVCTGGTCSTGGTTRLPTMPAFTRNRAKERANRVLRRRFGRIWTRGEARHLTCRRRGRDMYVCSVSWRYSGFRYRGTLIVKRNGIVRLRVFLRRR